MSSPKVESTSLVEYIERWQERARNIAPPEGTDIVISRGGLPGPAFFPEGSGLQNPTADAPWPDIMAIGHNFGCEDYRDEIETSGREDDKATWRNLRRLLTDASVPIESCFMTNWFVGLRSGNKQVGEFLSRPDARYERECSELLIQQIGTLKPKVILLLGLPVVQRAHRIIPMLRQWANATNWIAVDSSSLGPVAYEVAILGTGARANVVALLHPSFSPSNQRYRRTVFAVAKPEVEIVKCAVTRGLAQSLRRQNSARAEFPLQISGHQELWVTN